MFMELSFAVSGREEAEPLAVFHDGAACDEDALFGETQGDGAVGKRAGRVFVRKETADGVHRLLSGNGRAAGAFDMRGEKLAYRDDAPGKGDGFLRDGTAYGGFVKAERLRDGF